MMMQMVGTFAEFERTMIRERTSAGLAAARAEGRIRGRRKKLVPAKRREIVESVISGRKTESMMTETPPSGSSVTVAAACAPLFGPAFWRSSGLSTVVM